MKIEFNERGKEIERIINSLGDIPFKTFYGITMEEYINKLICECENTLKVAGEQTS